MYSWYIIQKGIHSSLNKIMEKKYKHLKQKLTKLEYTQTSAPKHVKTFYPRVVNNTNIRLNADELCLLNKGLKYNLSHKNKKWIHTLALETETAITQLPQQEQEGIRARAAHNIKHLFKQQSNQQHRNPNQAIKEYRILNHNKEKLQSNNAIITKADKGNSTVILYNKDYHNKVQDFIDNNNFTILKKDPTLAYQR